MRNILAIALTFIFSSCGEEVFIKPKAKLALQYATPDYQKTLLDCPYQFEVNNISKLLVNENCAARIEYQDLNATVFLTYRPVTPDRVEGYIFEAKKLAYTHKIKALSMPEQVYANSENTVYGTFFDINGETASHAQFYATDSVKNFLTASLYFDTKPNFDSLLPAIEYVREDMRVMMESLVWEK